MKVKKIILDVLPKNLITFAMGKITKSKCSKILIKPYAKLYDINVSVAEKNIEEYATLNDFFTRKIKKEERIIANSDVVSPSDGLIKEQGIIKEGKVLQIKGDDYEVKNLLRCEKTAKRMENGEYYNIYLSPKDYHRIHSPISGVITKCEHIEGKLYPVNENGIENVKGLYTKNERVNVYIENEEYEIVLSNVGALIVGSVKMNFCELKKNEVKMMNEKVEKGQEVGMFEFGSTVVMLLKEKKEKKENKKTEKKMIKMGEKIR